MGRTSASGVPGARSSGRTMMPSWSVPMATSSSARIIPSETWPRSLARLSLVPSGMTAPGEATATICPAATLGAPQTMWAGSPPSPTSTVHTLRRSASGWRSAVSTRPTRKASSAATPWRSTPSTLVPVMVRRSSSAFESSPGSMWSCSQRSGSLIGLLRVRGVAHAVLSNRRPRRSSELLRDPQVVVVEQPQVGHAVLERGDALDAHPPGEALVALGVVAVLAHVAEDVGIHLAGAQQLDPALALAQRAARAVAQEPVRAVEAGDVELDAGLGEREEVGTQADVAVVAEDRLRERLQRAREVGQRDVLVDREALDLVELRRVRAVVVAPVRASGDDDVQRRRVQLHDARLHRRGVRAQDDVVGHVEGVGLLAGRVLRRVVERVEVVVDQLGLRPLHDAEAEAHEDVLDLAAGGRDQMQA